MKEVRLTYRLYRPPETRREKKDNNRQENCFKSETAWGVSFYF